MRHSRRYDFQASRSSEVRVKVRRWPQSPIGSRDYFSGLDMHQICWLAYPYPLNLLTELWNSNQCLMQINNSGGYCEKIYFRYLSYFQLSVFLLFICLPRNLQNLWKSLTSRVLSSWVVACCVYNVRTRWRYMYSARTRSAHGVRDGNVVGTCLATVATSALVDGALFLLI